MGSFPLLFLRASSEPIPLILHLSFLPSNLTGLCVAKDCVYAVWYSPTPRQTLQSQLGQLPWLQTVRLARDIAAAMSALHAKYYSRLPGAKSVGCLASATLVRFLCSLKDLFAPLTSRGLFHGSLSPMTVLLEDTAPLITAFSVAPTLGQGIKLQAHPFAGTIFCLFVDS